MYAVLLAGQPIISTHLMRSEKREFGMDLQTDQRRMQKDWLLRPYFKLLPQHVLQGTFLLLLIIVLYVVNQRTTFSVWSMLTSCVGRGGKYNRTKIGYNW